jgi:hypothetical protein
LAQAVHQCGLLVQTLNQSASSFILIFFTIGSGSAPMWAFGKGL